MSKSENLKNIGEFELIDYIKKNVEEVLKKPDELLKGIGDDCAVIKRKDKVELISKDVLVEGIHFDVSYVPLKHLGFKAVATNISDICAMNGKARYILLGLSFSSKYSKEAVEEIMQGVFIACKQYGVTLIGGDTTTIPSGMVISITCIGEVGEEEVVYRSEAKTKELICITGDVGAAFVGLKILSEEKQNFIKNPDKQPILSDYQYVLKRQLRPEARIDVVDFLERKKIKPAAMIDISDGLSSDLIHICQASNTGCKIFKEKIPINEETKKAAKERGIDVLAAAMDGGEDYELLFTVEQKYYEEIEGNEDISIIGYMTSDKEMYHCVDSEKNKIFDIKPSGWKHQ